MIFSTRQGAKSGSFLVPVDEALLDAISGIADDAAAFAAGADEDLEEEVVAAPDVTPRVESKLSVREVQARLRAGDDVEDIAHRAGVEPAWVERFAPPIRAEQQQIVSRALATPMERPRAGLSGLVLRDAVSRSVAERDLTFTAESFGAAWSSRLVGAHLWAVEFRFTSRGRARTVAWTFDATTGRLTTSDRYASQIGFVDASPDGETPAVAGRRDRSNASAVEKPAVKAGTKRAPKRSAARGTAAERRGPTGAEAAPDDPEGAATRPAGKEAADAERAAAAEKREIAAAKKAATVKRAAVKKMEEDAAKRIAAARRAAQKKLDAEAKAAAREAAAQAKAAERKAAAEAKEAERKAAEEAKAEADAARAAQERRVEEERQREADERAALEAEQRRLAEEQAAEELAAQRDREAAAAVAAAERKIAEEKALRAEHEAARVAPREAVQERRLAEPETESGQHADVEVEAAAAPAAEERPKRRPDQAVVRLRAPRAPEPTEDPNARAAARQARAAARSVPTAQFRSGAVVRASSAAKVNGSRRRRTPVSVDDLSPAASDGSTATPDRPGLDGRRPRRTRQLRAR